MIEIPLTKGYVAIVDDKYAYLKEFNWKANICGSNIYAARNKETGGKWQTICMHRVIMESETGRKLLSSELIDHADGNGINNCVSNLRICTKQQNMWNMKTRKANTHGFKGVTKATKQPKTGDVVWQARIIVSGKRIHLGRFTSPEAAHAAYCEAAVKYFGEFARFE